MKFCLSRCKIYDTYQNAPFHSTVEVIPYILDYHGLANVFCLTGTGSYRGCVWCVQDGFYCQHLYRRLFLTDLDLREEDCHYFPQHSEKKRQGQEIQKLKQDVLFHKAYGNAKNQAQANQISNGTGCS